MAVSLAGKDHKALMEERAALVARAKAYHAKHEADWNDDHQYTMTSMIADAETLKGGLEKLSKLTKLMAQEVEANGHMDYFSDDPMRPLRAKFMADIKSGDHICLGRGDRLTSHAGFEQPCANALGESIRAMIAPASRFAIPEIKGFLGEGTDSSGGFTVQGQLAAQVIDLARAKSVLMAAGAQTVVMRSSETKLAKVLSAPAMETKAEGESFSDATMTFGAVALQAFTIGCYLEVSRELAADSANFSQLVESQVAKALAVSLDRLGIQGTGSGEPVGLTVNPDIDETGTIAGLTWDEVAAAARNVRNNNHEPNAVILNTGVDDLLHMSKDGENRWLGAPPKLADKKFLGTTNCPLAFGIVGDFTNLLWGIRQNALIETSNSGGELFKRHMTGLKITWRGDTALADASAFHRLAGITS